MRDRERHNAFQMAYHRRHRDERLAAMRKRYRKNVLQMRDYMLKRNYGISVDEFNAMIKAQGNICPACGELFSGTGKQKLSPTVHHNHAIKTPHALAIVHSRCNLIMGQAMDDPKLLQKVADFAARISQDPLECSQDPPGEGRTE